MNFFRRLFGKKKVKENLADSKNHPNHIIISGMQEDGSSYISNNRDLIIFNKPIQEKDDGKREYDSLKIAQQLLRYYSKIPLEPYEDELFLRALWLVIEAGEIIPSFKHSSRKQLVEITKFATIGDYQSAFDLIRNEKDEITARFLLKNIEPLFVSTYPIQTAEFLLESSYYPNYPLIKALAQAPAHKLIGSLLVNETNNNDRVEVLGRSLLYAMDAEKEVTGLIKKWEYLAKNPWQNPLNEMWLSLEISRLARVNIIEAHESYNKIRREFSPLIYTQQDFFLQLAKHDPQKALDSIDADAEIYDVLPGLIGCHQAGVDIGLKLNQLFQNFSSYSYRPHTSMGWLLKAGILRNDEEFIEKTLEKAGPKGWQTAFYARYPLCKLAESNPIAAKALLNTLMKPRKVGFVAGRDASTGLVVGSSMHKPQHLIFDNPKPVESLVIYADIAEKGPQWYTGL